MKVVSSCGVAQLIARHERLDRKPALISGALPTGVRKYRRTRGSPRKKRTTVRSAGQVMSITHDRSTRSTQRKQVVIAEQAVAPAWRSDCIRVGGRTPSSPLLGGRGRREDEGGRGEPGGDLLSHMKYALSSAYLRFTVLFGMGRGGSKGLWPPSVKGFPAGRAGIWKKGRPRRTTVVIESNGSWSCCLSDCSRL
jgi:hypothetical protein